MPKWEFLKRDHELEKIPIVFYPKSHRPMNEAEHVAHAKEVFGKWYDNAKGHLPGDLERGGAWLLEHAETRRDVLSMVDVVAESYRLIWQH